MRHYSKSRKEYGASKPRQESAPIDFFENLCDIHGRFGDTVYRRKRNGELYKYPYEYVPKYQPTVLSRRSECVMRKINTFTHQHQKGFESAFKKLYYYTPYFVYPGSYKFTCNCFLKLRKKGEYLIEIDGGIKQKQKLAPRSKLEYSFETTGEHVIRCYIENLMYCERKVVVISEEQVLEDVYAAWYDEHLLEILEKPDPQYAPLEKYFRCIFPPVFFTRLSGKFEDLVIYSTRHSYLTLGKHRDNYMYSRKLGSYENNEQSDYFLKVQSNINTCWKGIESSFRKVWEKYYQRRFDINYMKGWNAKSVGPHNLWSKLIFMAAKNLGFDLKTLSVEHFLTGVDTLGELLSAASIGRYGLTGNELGVKVY